MIKSPQGRTDWREFGTSSASIGRQGRDRVNREQCSVKENAIEQIKEAETVLKRERKREKERESVEEKVGKGDGFSFALFASVHV